MFVLNCLQTLTSKYEQNRLCHWKDSQEKYFIIGLQTKLHTSFLFLTVWKKTMSIKKNFESLTRGYRILACKSENLYYLAIICWNA